MSGIEFAEAEPRSPRRRAAIIKKSLAVLTALVLVLVVSASAASSATTYRPVVIANGWSPSDVGTAAPLAASLGGSVLYANKDSLGDPTVDALKQLKPSEVILVGGTAILNPDIETELGRVVPGVPVTRLAGDDRIHTAALAALHTLGKSTPDSEHSGAATEATTAGAEIQRAGDITYRERRFRVGTDLRPGDWYASHPRDSCYFGLGDADKDDRSNRIDVNGAAVSIGGRSAIRFGLVEGDIVILQARAGNDCSIEHERD